MVTVPLRPIFEVFNIYSPFCELFSLDFNLLSFYNLLIEFHKILWYVNNVGIVQILNWKLFYRLIEFKQINSCDVFRTFLFNWFTTIKKLVKRSVKKSTEFFIGLTS